MSDIHNIIKALADAQTAVDRVPELEFEVLHLSEVNAQLESTKSRHEDYIEELAKKLQASEIRANALEAQLDQATFRESETARRLEVLQSMVRGALDTVTPSAKPEYGGCGSPTDQSASPLSPTIDVPSTEPFSSEIVPSAQPSTENASSSDRSTYTFTPEADIVTPVPRFAGQESWRKPSDMTWGDWKSQGGDTPNWVDSAHF
jgi:hypothetical protein